MDPNETLTGLRQCIQRMDVEDHNGDLWLGSALALADFADALDDWLSRGGFLPDAWQAETHAPDCGYCAAGEPMWHRYEPTGG